MEFFKYIWTKILKAVQKGISYKIINHFSKYLNVDPMTLTPPPRELKWPIKSLRENHPPPHFEAI